MKQKRKKQMLALLLAACILVGSAPTYAKAVTGNTVYVSQNGADGQDGTDPAAPLATIAAAYAAVGDGGRIVLLSDLSVASAIRIDQSKSVTIDGAGYSITYTGAATISPDRGGVLTVTAGTLALTEITVQMPELRGANGRVLYVGTGSAVTLQDGAVLANGYLGYGGGVAKVGGGTLVMMDGAEIRGGYIANNTTAYGGGVLVAAGTFEIQGGRIQGNTIHTTLGYESYGGGVAVLDGAVLHMTGGEIRDNQVDSAGGGVYLAPGGILALGGGATITENKADNVESNLYLPTTDAAFSQVAAATGSIGVSHGEADYGVVVGVPDGYGISSSDETAYHYDGGDYDIRLRGGNLILDHWTVRVEINGEGFDSAFTGNETPRGENFDTTITPDDGYRLPDSITVTVGGTELGEDSYSYNPSTGEVHIPGGQVAGDLVITVHPNAVYSITVSTANVTASLGYAEVTTAATTIVRFVANNRYALPDAVAVSGPCDYTYSTGELTISKVTGDVTVSAAGAEVYHQIHFDPAGGTVDKSNVTIVESQATIGMLPSPARTGYTFIGWFTTTGQRVTADTANHLTADLYLTARWSANTNIRYQVQHWLELLDSGRNPGYVQGVSATQQMEYQGESRTYYLYHAQTYHNGISSGHTDISALILAEVDGLDIAGITASGANTYSVITAPDSSSVFPLYYNRRSYRLTFDPNGGTLAGAAQAQVLYGGMYGVFPGAVRPGYTLAGWYTDAQGGSAVMLGEPILTAADQTLYAHWVTTGDTAYTVIHRLQELRDNLVSNEKTPEAYSIYQTETLYADADTAVDVYALAIPGFIPSGENRYSVNVTADGSGSVTLYYDRMATTVNYDPNGGTLAVPGVSHIVYYGGTLASLPTDPARGGYTFDGWYTGTDETAQKVAAGMPLADFAPETPERMTLYAHWTKAGGSNTDGDDTGGGSGPLPPRPVKPEESGEHAAYIKGYPDGTVRPLGNILRCEAAAIMARVSEGYDPGRVYPVAFLDVPERAWYRNELGYCVETGMITGYPDGTFRPMANIDRGEFAAIAARYLGLDNIGTAGFTDVSTGYWADGYIGQLARRGIVSGNGKGQYLPTSALSRAEAVKVVNGILRRGTTLDHMLVPMIVFTDNQDKRRWYYADIQEAANGHSYTRSTTGVESWSELIR